MHPWLRWTLALRSEESSAFRGTLYVEEFMTRLHALADRLASMEDRDIKARVNRMEGCVELCTSDFVGEIVAQVRVQGECCSPTRAIVKTNLRRSHLTIFRYALRPLIVEFEPFSI